MVIMVILHVMQANNILEGKYSTVCMLPFT